LNILYSHKYEIYLCLILFLQYISGNAALLFTDSDLKTTQEYFESFTKVDFARSGTVCNQMVTIPKGEVKEKAHSMLEEFRSLGLPVDLERGVIHFRKDYVVCRVGQTLTPEQCRILKHFNYLLSEFKLTVKAMWHDGETQVFGDEDEVTGEGDAEMDEEEDDDN
jgi:mRNA turnover protein 4